ncbi:Inner membrane protein YrbG, predicted calcium/sodium:proton antiporter [Candidatus Syntrophocurvum alkaliphilum]|uniref:Inner membrane protein YrbG, predicted calcium/sodium:proton antiporter n=1 Tax=Candidatus Syntrophocurvum alkaliphilum TaxID=2293317 RepID=A0A6I6DBQ5_9FIRM|nr:calcium/sodium antiporter [Candidatus Syntrophocurvum alkaliphilum]QGT98620.1 Inner membrane protein YrbG, predicted calcium/sodium:proton antiporter [Candidatus Syntrophocurvum alkaliphilum]
MDYILLIIGFVLLIKGADIFVDGASSIAKITNVPPLLIGLTIVAFGTSAPEAAICINASLQGSGDLVLGNVIGSNMFNLLLAVGVASTIRAIKIKKTTVIKEFPLSIYATALMFLLSLDVYLGGQPQNLISRADGLILLLGLGIFIFYLVELAFMSKETEEEVDEIKTMTLPKSILFFIIGLVAIILGGDLVVKSATNIALAWGISETLVGLTIVSLGTSLPELVIAAIASIKEKIDIAMGNIIGSGLFNILFVLGISAVINPIEVDSKLYVDFSILLIITTITYIFAITGRKIDRIEGIILTLTYIGYIIFIVIRN